MPAESATFGPNSIAQVGRCYGYHPTTLAKKARTPTPPRPVQAPKRRDTKQRQQISSSDRRTRLILYGFAALGPIALVIVLAVFLLGGNSSSGKATGKAPNIDYAALPGLQKGPDRKSTRLNSSHSQISYAVFCLKKKKHA